MADLGVVQVNENLTTAHGHCSFLRLFTSSRPDRSRASRALPCLLLRKPAHTDTANRSFDADRLMPTKSLDRSLPVIKSDCQLNLETIALPR